MTDATQAQLDEMADDIEQKAEEEAKLQTVVLVGPREGFTGYIAGLPFKWVNGETELPTKLPNGDIRDTLRMLRAFHNAHLKGSPAHKKAVELWEAKTGKKARPAPTAEVAPSAPSPEGTGDGKPRDLSTVKLGDMSNKELVQFAKQTYGEDIDKPNMNKLKLIEAINELEAKRQFKAGNAAKSNPESA